MLSPVWISRIPLISINAAFSALMNILPPTDASILPAHVMLTFSDTIILTDPLTSMVSSPTIIV